MSLWGKNDNVTSGGTVTLDYASGIGTGAGTNFGNAGYAKTGDIIRFGYRGDGGTFYGDAVIKDITSTTAFSIGNTFGLSGDSGGGAAGGFAGTSFYISELPIYTVDDHSFSNKHDTVATYQHIGSNVGDITAEDETAIGQLNIAASYAGSVALSTTGFGEDAIVNGGNEIRITGLGVGYTATTHGSGIGSDTLYADFPGISEASSVYVTSGGAGQFVTITGTGATTVTIGSTISSVISSGDLLTFQGNQIISLESAVTAGIATGDSIQFKRKTGGYDRIIYGISTDTSQDFDGVSTKYRTSGGGWVGVTTYRDCDGNFRVKSEILVAIGGNSGIETGAYGIAYPTPK